MTKDGIAAKLGIRVASVYRVLAQKEAAADLTQQSKAGWRLLSCRAAAQAAKG